MCTSAIKRAQYMRLRGMSCNSNIDIDIQLNLSGTIMKTRTFVAAMAITAAALMLTISQADAQGRRGGGPGGGPGGHRGDMMGKAMEKLNLSQSQKDQIKSLHESLKSANQAKLDELKSLQEQMRDKMKSGDKEGAKAIREQIKSKREALKPAREKLHQDVLALLTPEQRDQLAKLKKEAKDRRKENRRGGRGNPGAGRDQDAID